MEGQRWGGERNQSTKRGGDKKEEDGRGTKKGKRRREERELKEHDGRKHCERDGMIQGKFKNSLCEQ